MDGHGFKGEIVSQYAMSELPQRLSKRLEQIHGSSADQLKEREEEVVKSVIADVFLDINATIPTQGEGGCTASIMFRMGDNAYFANVGDSRVFLVSYDPATKEVNIIFETMEHKPSLPEEKARIKQMGGQVYEPSQKEIELGDSSRLVTPTVSLAMSRSLGDWSCSPYGAIALPTVNVVDLKQFQRQASEGGEETCTSDESNNDSPETDIGHCKAGSKHLPIKIFALAATDGLLDFVKPIDFATKMAHSLYESGLHNTTACEQLIMEAADGWYKDMGSDYRDDIAISVMKVL